jgi:hypothetical protein
MSKTFANLLSDWTRDRKVTGAELLALKYDTSGYDLARAGFGTGASGRSILMDLDHRLTAMRQAMDNQRNG